MDRIQCTTCKFHGDVFPCNECEDLYNECGIENNFYEDNHEE